MRKPDSNPTDMVEALASRLTDEVLPLRPAERLRVNSMIRYARLWRKRALELQEKLGELQWVVDQSISGLDPNRR